MPGAAKGALPPVTRDFTAALSTRIGNYEVTENETAAATVAASAASMITLATPTIAAASSEKSMTAATAATDAAVSPRKSMTAVTAASASTNKAWVAAGDVDTVGKVMYSSVGAAYTGPVLSLRGEETWRRGEAEGEVVGAAKENEILSNGFTYVDQRAERDTVDVVSSAKDVPSSILGSCCSSDTAFDASRLSSWSLNATTAEEKSGRHPHPVGDVGGGMSYSSIYDADQRFQRERTNSSSSRSKRIDTNNSGSSGSVFHGTLAKPLLGLLEVMENTKKERGPTLCSDRDNTSQQPHHLASPGGSSERACCVEPNHPSTYNANCGDTPVSSPDPGAEITQSPLLDGENRCACGNSTLHCWARMACHRGFKPVGWGKDELPERCSSRSIMELPLKKMACSQQRVDVQLEQHGLRSKEAVATVEFQEQPLQVDGCWNQQQEKTQQHRRQNGARPQHEKGRQQRRFDGRWREGVSCREGLGETLEAYACSDTRQFAACGVPSRPYVAIRHVQMGCCDLIEEVQVSNNNGNNDVHQELRGMCSSFGQQPEDKEDSQQLQANTYGKNAALPSKPAPLLLFVAPHVAAAPYRVGETHEEMPLLAESAHHRGVGAASATGDVLGSRYSPRTAAATVQPSDISFSHPCPTCPSVAVFHMPPIAAAAADWERAASQLPAGACTVSKTSRDSDSFAGFGAAFRKSDAQKRAYAADADAPSSYTGDSPLLNSLLQTEEETRREAAVFSAAAPLVASTQFQCCELAVAPTARASCGESRGDHLQEEQIEEISSHLKKWAAISPPVWEGQTEQREDSEGQRQAEKHEVLHQKLQQRSLWLGLLSDWVHKDRELLNCEKRGGALDGTAAARYTQGLMGEGEKVRKRLGAAAERAAGGKAAETETGLPGNSESRRRREGSFVSSACSVTDRVSSPSSSSSSTSVSFCLPDAEAEYAEVTRLRLSQKEEMFLYLLQQQEVLLRPPLLREQQAVAKQLQTKTRAHLQQGGAKSQQLQEVGADPMQKLHDWERFGHHEEGQQQQARGCGERHCMAVHNSAPKAPTQCGVKLNNCSAGSQETPIDSSTGSCDDTFSLKKWNCGCCMCFSARSDSPAHRSARSVAAPSAVSPHFSSEILTAGRTRGDACTEKVETTAACAASSAAHTAPSCQFACRRSTCTQWNWRDSHCQAAYATKSMGGSGRMQSAVNAVLWREQTGFSYATAESESSSASAPAAVSAVGRRVLLSPQLLLRTVGVAGAPPLDVEETEAVKEAKIPQGERNMAILQQSAPPRHVRQSHSVLKRAASADPASGRYVRVKTVSFANLNECDISSDGKYTSTLQDTKSAAAGVARGSPAKVGLSTSTAIAGEVRKDSSSGSIRDHEGETAGVAAAAGEGGKELAELRGARATVTVQKTGEKVSGKMLTSGMASGGRQAGPGGAVGEEWRKEEGSTNGARKNQGRQVITYLSAPLSWGRDMDRGGGTVTVVTDRGVEDRREETKGSAIAAKRGGWHSKSSSSFISSEDGLLRREEEMFSISRDRRRVTSSRGSSSGSNDSSSEGEVSGGGSSGGERRKAIRKGRKRAATKRRRRRAARDSNRNGGGDSRSPGSPGFQIRRSDCEQRSTGSSPSVDGRGGRFPTRLAAVARNIFRAVQNLTEHDMVFHMQDKLSKREATQLSHTSAPPEGDVAAGAVSPSSTPAALTGGTGGGRSSPRDGRGGEALSSGLQYKLSGLDSAGAPASAGAITLIGTGGGESSLSRSVSSDVLLRRLPLKFVDKDLEMLFASNINQWMTARLLLMGMLMLVVTGLMWPLMSWSFNLQDAFNHNEPIGILFHVDMSLTVIVSVIFILTRFVDVFSRHAEFIGDAGTFSVVTIWGVWNIVASYFLESSYVRDVIHPQAAAGHQGYVSLDKTTSWSSAQEASSAVAYLYGLLLIVQLDVVYPSRTRRTWQIHLMFFLLSSASIIVRGAVNPNFVPVPFVVLRVITYLMLTFFLYIGRHATELQQRQTFYNWLMTRKRVDRLESDLKRQKESGKVSTAVEQLLDLIKQCKETLLNMESTIGDVSSFSRTQMCECNRMLDRCLLILTNTTNLYTVQFGELDSDTHRDIIQAFLNTHSSSPADWTRVARGAYRRDSNVGGAHSFALNKAASSPLVARARDLERGVSVDVHPPPRSASVIAAPPENSIKAFSPSDAGFYPASSKGSTDEVNAKDAPLGTGFFAGIGAAAARAADASRASPSCTAGAGAAAAPSAATRDERSTPSPEGANGETLFDFRYGSPEGVHVFDGEAIAVQSPRKKTHDARNRGETTAVALPGDALGDERRMQMGEAADVKTSRPERKLENFLYWLPRKTVAAARNAGIRKKYLPTFLISPASAERARGRADDLAVEAEGSGERVCTGRGQQVPSGGEVALAAAGGEEDKSGILLLRDATGRERGPRVETGRVGSTAVANGAAGRGGVATEGELDVAAGLGAEPPMVNRVERRLPSSAVAAKASKDDEVAAAHVESAQPKESVSDEGVVAHAGASPRRHSSATPLPSSVRRNVLTADLVYRAIVMDQRGRREMRTRNEAVAKILGLTAGSPQLKVVQRLSEEEVQSWDFDCLLYAKESPAPLVEVGYALLAGPCEDLMLPNKEVLVRFLKAVEAQYNAVPYHNSIHGCMVTQKMVALTHLLNLTSKMSSRDLAVMTVAGLCHDLGHPGRNNALLINAIDPVAVLYNDKSVLENYHSCLTFKTLDLPNCDVFSTLRSKLRREYHLVRSLIIELILATDMKNHFETVSRFRIRRLAADFDTSNEEDLWFLLKIVIKCADLSHCGVNWSQHFEWCLRLCTEFYDQGDEELARHLPVSPLCEREKHPEIAKAQLGFINFVTMPLYEELLAVDSTGNVERCCMAYMKVNVNTWEVMVSAGVRVPLYGKDVTPDVQPPLSNLLDQTQHPKPKAGSKAAEIASRYAHVTLTCIDLTPLVMHTQLARSRLGSQL